MKRDAVKPGNLLRVVLAVLVSLSVNGCAGRRPRAYSVVSGLQADQRAVACAQSTLAQLYPTRYRATQRAILSIGQRQYVVDGVLEVSPQTGQHLVVLSTLGLVTELQIDTNATTRVLRTTPLFREAWSRNFVARDLRLLFAVPENLVSEGRLADGRLVLRTQSNGGETVTRYIFNASGERLEEVEAACGRQRCYQAVFRRYGEFPGFSRKVPSEVFIKAPAYCLELRTAAVTRLESSAATGTGDGGT